MRTGRVIDGIVVMMAMAASVTHAQVLRVTDPGPRVLISSRSPSSNYPAPAGDIVQEIDDPRNGDRWLLMEDDSHPGGPGRLVLVASRDGSVNWSQSGKIRDTSQTATGADAAPPVIRAGDRVVVEENTAVVEAHLEAVAMGPAWAGYAFNARLSIGGRIVRAVAAGPGRAFFQEGTRP